MQHFGRVREFIISNAPRPVCDDCVAEKLNLPADKPMVQRINVLAQLPGFVRERAGCKICRQIKEVTFFDPPAGLTHLGEGIR
jgi:hypothetical protein